jgi:hypothetical protein
VHFVDELPLSCATSRSRAARARPAPRSEPDGHAPGPFEPFGRARPLRRTRALELPIGSVDAHHLRVEADAGGWAADFWFDADASAPRLHALVQLQGPDGRSCRLKSLVRVAYWKH